ncbi:MAG: putative Ig domain-containing protein [Holophagaceae bacterium]|nr:putative Ig domain-containing protein [Holophagaceae bacterium]
MTRQCCLPDREHHRDHHLHAHRDQRQREENFRHGHRDRTDRSGLTYTHEDATYYAGVRITDNPVATITGDAPLTYTVNPALPSGLTLNPTTGAISGTPVAVTAQGTYTVTATNAVIASSTTRDLKITVAATPISFTASPTTLAPGSSTVLTWDANSVPGIFTAVTISATPADITLPATFTLAGTANVTPMVTTTYTLTATPAGGGAAITKTCLVLYGPGHGSHPEWQQRPGQQRSDRHPLWTPGVHPGRIQPAGCGHRHS